MIPGYLNKCRGWALLWSRCRLPAWMVLDKHHSPVYSKRTRNPLNNIICHICSFPRHPHKRWIRWTNSRDFWKGVISADKLFTSLFVRCGGFMKIELSLSGWVTWFIHPRGANVPWSDWLWYDHWSNVIMYPIGILNMMTTRGYKQDSGWAVKKWWESHSSVKGKGFYNRMVLNINFGLIYLS